MKKVILSLFLALTVSFTVVSPVVYAAAAVPQGVEAVQADIGEIIDSADEIVSFLNDFMQVVHYVKDIVDNTDDPAAFVKSTIDNAFNGLVSSAINLLPGGEFINLIGAWVGLSDFSITDFFGQKVQDFCNANRADMQEFYSLGILPLYGSVDTFVDDIYGDLYSPGSNTPQLPSGDPVAVIGNGSTSFVSGFLIPFLYWCLNSEVILAFLAVDFVIFGFSILRRTVGAFGRGR